MTEVPLGDVPPLRLGFCHAYAVRAGGLGDVYLCRREIEPRHVAVKRLHDEIARMPGAAQRFIDECRMWMRLGHHPNIVTAISAHAAPPEPPMLVLEYVPRSLRDLLEDGPLSVSAILRIAAGICDAMEHLQAVFPSFVHLDLKPENVLITDDGQPKVTDFGLAKVRSLVPAPGATARSTGLVGTPAYMSPEQCLLLPTTVASDVYAFGCLLCEMIVGRGPFPDASQADDYLVAHVREPPSLPDARHGHGLRALVASCLDKQPMRRPRSFAAVREALEAVAAGHGITLPQPVAPAVPDDQRMLYAQGLVNVGAHPEARQSAEAVRSDSSHPSARLWATTLIARSYLDEGRPDLAAPFLDVGDDWLEGVGPVIVGAYWNEVGRVSADPQAAERAYQRAVDIVPDASVGWWNLATVQYQLSKVDLAISSATRALEISGDLRYFTGLCEMLRWERRFAEAMQVARAATRYHPTAPQAWAAVAAVIIDENGLEASVDELGQELQRLAAIDDPGTWSRQAEQLVARLYPPEA